MHSLWKCARKSADGMCKSLCIFFWAC